MRYFVLCISFLFVFTNGLLAQQSIGFSDPDNIQSLLDYRLPDWGYSNFYLNLNTNGSGINQKEGSSEQAQKAGNFNIRPSYELFRESEERIIQLNAFSDFQYGTNVRTTDPSFTNTQTKSRDGVFRFDLNAFANLREYITEESFMYGEAAAQIDYISQKSEVREDDILEDKLLTFNRIVRITPRIGYGFGRIRNVNPLIRAVRLKERADALSNGLSFRSQDVFKAADQLTRYDGYQQTYDRPSKHFWGDMDEAIAPNLSSLDPFDMLFLTDVLDEAIGTRLEGWEVIGGIQFDYENNLDREEEPLDIIEPVMRDLTINKEIGAFLSGRWYKNSSLRQQWGMTGDLELSYLLDEDEGADTDPQRRFMIRTGVNWLWNITDRILFQSSLDNFHRRTKVEDTNLIGGGSTTFTEWTNQITIGFGVNYFIENQLVLNVSLGPSLLHRGDSESDNKLNSRVFSWNAKVGLQYYLSRNLY